MNRRIVFTHRAWFGPCPVYLADLTTDEPIITPRWPWADVVLHIWVSVCDAWERLLRWINADFDLQVAFWRVRELDVPIVAEREPGG